MLNVFALESNRREMSIRLFLDVCVSGFMKLRIITLVLSEIDGITY